MIDAISHFRIVNKLGSGGMGEVYLAEDTRLRRSVALKVLPPELADNQERVRRFEQEACAASGLSHPNILVVYEVGVDQGRHYIATEYVEGRTLRRRMAGHALPAAEALDVALQVASALAAAHEAGIVHRDIKPENIMVRGDGYVKVVDFGLAKLGLPDDMSEGIAEEALTETEPGKVMGTVHYMSPEQARGLPVDARTDIFSLGVVLYEALAGQPPFRGETRSDVLAALLATEPPPLPPHAQRASAELPWVLAKMLRKDRDERYQTAKELLADLRRVKERLHASTQVPPAPSLASEAPSTSRGRAARRVAVPLVAALLGLAAVTSWMSRPSPSAAIPEPRLGELVRFDARTRSWAPYLSGMSAHHLDFSPDGQWIAYVDYPEGTLCRSRSDGSGRTQLTFPPLRAATPRWSPDGTRIVFVAALPDKPWKIHMVAPERSPARPLSTEDREERTPGWSPDGRKIVFWVTGDKKDDRLIRILDLVTHRESAVPGSEGKYSARWSPNGRSLLALRFADNSLSVFDLGKGRWTELAGPDLSWPQWSRDGRHIYVQTIDGATVFRVALADRRVEPWASLKVVPRVSRLEPFGYWMGLTPDDSPLVLAKWGASLKGHTAAPPAP